MKIKNIFFTIVAMICLIVLALFTFTACGKDKHSFAKEWSSNKENHWHACTKSGCEEVSGKEKHIYDGDSDFVCNVCGFRRTPSQNSIDIKSTITKTYNGLAQGLVQGTDFTVANGSASVTYKVKDSEESFSTTKPEAVGTYIAKIVVPANASYSGINKEVEFKIDKYDLNKELGEVVSVRYSGSSVYMWEVFKTGTMSSSRLFVKFTFENKNVDSLSVGAELITENSDKTILDNYNFDSSKISAKICKKLIHLGNGTNDRRLKINNTLDGGFSIVKLDSNFNVLNNEDVSLKINKTFDWASGSKIMIVSDEKDYVLGQNELATIVGEDARNYELCETASATFTKLETAFSSYFSGFEDYAFGTAEDRIVYGEKSFIVSKSEGKNWFELLSSENSSKEVEIRVWCGSALIATIHRTGTAGNYTYTGGSFDEKTGVAVFNLSENISGYTDEQGRWICETKSVTLSLQLYVVEG